MKLIINQDCYGFELSATEIMALALQDSNVENLKQSIEELIDKE